MSEELVFIGGPWDGKKKTVDSYDEVTVPVMHAGNFNWSMYRDSPSGDAILYTLENVTYRRERIRAGDQTVDFFVVQGVSNGEALRRIFSNYRPIA